MSLSTVIVVPNMGLLATAHPPFGFCSIDMHCRENAKASLQFISLVESCSYTGLQQEEVATYRND
jgi:hypothetical protein